MFRIADIHEEICRMSQGSLDVSSYYTELKSLWDELENFRPLPSCKCAIQCSCGAVQSLQTFRDQDYTIRFLKGLNDEYSHVRSQIMLMDPFPPVTKAFALVTQQERQFHIPTISDVDGDLKSITDNVASVNNVYSNRGRGGYNNRGRGRSNGGGRGQNQNRYCTNCKRSNHTIDTCYLLHGYPPGYQNRSNKGAQSGSSVNLASTVGIEERSQITHTPATSNSGFSFTQDQYKSLLDLLQQNKQQASSAIHSANTTLTNSNTSSTNPFVLNVNSNSDFGNYQEDDWYS